MVLPQTACLALPGPIGPVPGTPNGRAWYSEEDDDGSFTVRLTLCLPCLVCLYESYSEMAFQNLHVCSHIHE